MPIPTLPFGRLGHESTRTVFGAAALGSVSQGDADRTLDVLLKYGVNHIDVAASYGDAELRIAPWLRPSSSGGHREQFFVATKTGKRKADEAREELHRSLDSRSCPRNDGLQAAVVVRGLANGAGQVEVAGGVRRDLRHDAELESEDRRHRPFADRHGVLHRLAAQPQQSGGVLEGQ